VHHSQGLLAEAVLHDSAPSLALGLHSQALEVVVHLDQAVIRQVQYTLLAVMPSVYYLAVLRVGRQCNSRKQNSVPPQGD